MALPTKVARILIRPAVVLLAFLLIAPGASDAFADPGGNPRPGWTDISYGFKAGFSLSQHSGVKERDAEYDVTSYWRKAAAAGVFLYLPVTSRFGLQQELFYAQKGSRQDIGVEILEIPTILKVTYDMDYVEIPAFLKFAWVQWNRNAIYTLAGTALSFKVRDRYTLQGEVSDGTETVPLRADSDMSEVEMFDYSFVYGLGLDFSLRGTRFLMEYRFSIGWNRLAMPTYAYVPFEDEEILIENEPVPLKNQNHLLLIGITF
jgi:hypothetical protein